MLLQFPDQFRFLGMYPPTPPLDQEGKARPQKPGFIPIFCLSMDHRNTNLKRLDLHYGSGTTNKRPDSVL